MFNYVHVNSEEVHKGSLQVDGIWNIYSVDMAQHYASQHNTWIKLSTVSTADTVKAKTNGHKGHTVWTGAIYIGKKMTCVNLSRQKVSLTLSRQEQTANVIKSA